MELINEILNVDDLIIQKTLKECDINEIAGLFLSINNIEKEKISKNIGTRANNLINDEMNKMRNQKINKNYIQDFISKVNKNL